MDNLEQYIRQNAEAFNDKEVPEGHLERFEILHSTLRQAQGGPQDDNKVAQDGGPQDVRRGVRRIIWAAVGIAAALAAIIFISRPVDRKYDLVAENDRFDRHEDWFANVGNDQAEICRAFYEKAGELCYDILSMHPDGSLDGSLSSLSEEAVTIVEQLPEEMDPEARIAVLKEYYGNLLDGLDQMKKVK